MSNEEIKFDAHNYRTHDEKNLKLIKKSLKELGAGRSVLIDKEGALIAGNGVYEQAKKLNIPTKIIETDGSELIVVQRKDLATKDLKRKKLAVMDNSASDSSDFDLFGGSGSTLIACEQLDRKCYMMELDPHYCDVILTRWESLTGKKAVRLTGGKNGL